MIWLQTATVFLARWRKPLSLLMNVRGVNDVRQTDIHTAWPLGPEPSDFEDEMPTEKLRRHKLPGTDQIPAKPIKEGGKTIRSAIRNLLILFEISRNCPRTIRADSHIACRAHAIPDNAVLLKAMHHDLRETACGPTVSVPLLQAITWSSSKLLSNPYQSQMQVASVKPNTVCHGRGKEW